MATSLHVSRRPKVNALPDLQADTEVWQVTVDLESLLASKALPLITAADVLTALQTPYPGATLANDPPEYWWYLDEDTGKWVFTCRGAGVVVIPGTAGKDPILVTVENRAIYGPPA